MAEQSSALDSSSGVVRMWVRILAWPFVALVSLSKTLDHNCFVLRMGRKAVGPVCCVMHVNEPRTLIAKEKGLASVFLDSRLEHPAGWICARYISSVLLLLTVGLWMELGHPALSKVSMAGLYGVQQTQHNQPLESDRFGVVRVNIIQMVSKSIAHDTCAKFAISTRSSCAELNSIIRARSDRVKKKGSRMTKSWEIKNAKNPRKPGGLTCLVKSWKQLYKL